jgi:hypothetical protein
VVGVGGRGRFLEGMTERKARTGESRFFAALRMTTKKAKAKKKQIPRGNDRKKGKYNGEEPR